MFDKSLNERIQDDKSKSIHTYDRYPIRFVFLDVEDYNQDETIKFLTEKNIVHIGDIVTKKHDGWLTKGEFIKSVKSCMEKEQDSVIIGFSEYARFLSNADLESILLTLCDFENSLSNNRTRKRRIYILCFSLKEKIYQILHDKYKRMDIFNPFINDDYVFNNNEIKHVYFASPLVENLFNVHSNIMRESQEWLSLCRNIATIDVTRPIICVSEVLYKWYAKANPDNAYQIESIENHKDYLDKICGVSINYEYIHSDADKWEEILKICDYKKSDITVNKILSSITNQLDNDELLLTEKWLNIENDFEKWFIKQYAINYSSNSFVNCMFSILTGNQPEDLFEAFWTVPNNIVNASNCRERCEIAKFLSKFADFSVPEDLLYKNYMLEISKISEVTESKSGYIYINSDVYTKSRLLDYFKNSFSYTWTGLSEAERKILLILLSNQVIDLKDIKYLYPELHSYLNSVSIEGQEWIETYLQEYKYSKIIGQDTDKLKSMVSEYSGSEDSLYSWYNKLSTQSELLKQCTTTIYIIDGLGAEYFSVLEYLLKKHKCVIEKKEYVKSHLPTITSINKNYITKYDEWYTEFDRDVIHGEIYRFPQNLLKAITILEDIVCKIAEKEKGNAFVITADHGATCRARWTFPEKKYSFEKADHEGRCCVTKDIIESTEDYVFYEDKNVFDGKYIISLRDISLYNNPKYEDHGGATIEESIVPFVCIAATMDDNIKYTVTPIKTDVNGIDKTVEFKILPAPAKVIIQEDDGSCPQMTLDGSILKCELNSGREQRVNLIIANQNFEFQIKSTNKNFMKEDDGFDD